jgi:hypothetical protein
VRASGRGGAEEEREGKERETREGKKWKIFLLLLSSSSPLLGFGVLVCLALAYSSFD